MAGKTGRIETSKTSQYQTYFYVKWTTTQDSVNNKTTVNWEIHLDTPRESWYSNAVRIDYLKINNTTVKSSQTFSNISHTDYTLASGSNSFSHDSNGNLTLSFSFSGWLYGDGTFTATGEQEQDQIIVCTAATISSVTSQVAFGGNCTINITKGKNNDNNNCTYKLTYSCNGQTGTALSTSSSSKPSSHLFSTDNFNLIKNNTSNVTCTLTLTTYWNNNSVGSSSKSFVIVIPQPASNFNVIQGEDINYQFDKEYIYSFTDNSSDKYTYKLKIGTDDLIDASSGSTLTVSSAQCVDAESKNIDIYLYTYNGNAAFSNPQKVTELFNILNTDDYKPSLSLSIEDIEFKNMPNDTIFLNGSRQSSIIIPSEIKGGKSGNNYCDITSVIISSNKIDLEWTNTQIILYLRENFTQQENIDITVTDSRGRYKSSSLSVDFRSITVKNYIPLSIKDVKVYNEYQGYNQDYTQGFYISYSLQSTDNTVASISGVMVLSDNSNYSLDKDDNDSALIPQDTYSGSPLSKTITITASLYDEPTSYTLYLAPQEKALNLYNGNKVIRVGGMAKEVDLYILLTTQPIDWSNNYTYYYKKQYNLLSSEPDDWESNKTNYYKQVDNEYVSVVSTDVWVVNAYYSLEYVSVESTDTWAANTYYQKRDKWGLVVSNFDLTITDTEIAILKNKFGI